MNEKEKKVFDIYKSDVLEFARDFLPHFLTSKVPDFHKEMYEMLLRENRIALAAPRGFAKSFICSVIYPLHSALFEFHRDICIISASESLAIEWLRKIRRELESNPTIIKYFGDLQSDKWTENHLILKNGVNIRARGAGSQIRGFRPDLIILDDIETDESVASEEQRNKLRGWIFKACLNTLVPDGKFILIGTIISPLTLLAEILASDNNWVKRKYRAYIDGVQEKGKELWPDLWQHERLQQRKAEIGSFAFSSEFLNDPLSNETAPIKTEHIRYWETLPSQYSCVIAVDPAYSDDEKSDHKVAAVVAIDNQQNRYLIEYVRTHAPIGEFQNSIINLYYKHKGQLTGVGIPNSGVEKSFFDSFQTKCMEKGVFGIPIAELSNTYTNSVTSVSARNKKARIIASLQPLFEQGKYYIAKHHTEAKDELLSIGASRWDDLVDCMSYAEQILQPVFFNAQVVEEIAETHRPVGVTGYGDDY